MDLILNVILLSMTLLLEILGGCTFLSLQDLDWWMIWRNKPSLGLHWGKNPIGWMSCIAHNMMMIAFGGLRDTL
jgi:hypothetical protein